VAQSERVMWPRGMQTAARASLRREVSRLFSLAARLAARGRLVHRYTQASSNTTKQTLTEHGTLTVPNWRGCFLHNTKLAKHGCGVIKWRSRPTRMLQIQITPSPYNKMSVPRAPSPNLCHFTFWFTCNHHVHGEKKETSMRGQWEVFEHGKITYVASLVTHQHNCYLFILFYFHIKMSGNAYYLPVRFTLFGSVLLPSFW
jgi:hypothetical protein